MQKQESRKTEDCDAVSSPKFSQFAQKQKHDKNVPKLDLDTLNNNLEQL